MFTKNIFSLIFCLLTTGIIASDKLGGEFTKTNDKIVGGITKTGVQDFTAGFGIGLMQGLVNNAFAPTVITPMNGLTSHVAFKLSTYAAASHLDGVYNDHKNSLNFSTLWGRAIGQVVGQSINLDAPLSKPTISFNVTLGFASMLSLFSCLKEQYEKS
jgi:hypothetical protein